MTGPAEQKQSHVEFRLLTRLFFRLLPYQALLIVINAVNGIVDGLVASNAVGAGAMNAIGLYTPMTHFLFALSITMVSGSQLLYGLYLANKPEAIQGVFSVDLLLSGAVSALAAAAVILSVISGATASMASGDNLRLFNRYLIGQAFGIPPLVLGQQLFAFLSLENQTRRTMAASIACFAANAVMDILLTVVIPLDALGLGLATAVSEWLFFGVQAVYYLSGKSQLRFSLRSCRRQDALEIVRRGYSGALSRFVEMFRCIVVNILILKYVGDVGISSFAASNSFLGIIWALPYGMMAVERILLSISIGEEDRTSILNILRIVFRRCFPLMCAVSLILVLSAVPLTRMFYRDPSDPIYSMTVMGFRLLPLCMPLAVISLAFACYAQAAQKKTMSVVLPVIDGFVGVSVCSLFLIPLMKMNGLYIANILNGVICLIVIVLFAWKDCGHFPKSVEDLAAIPADFGAREADRLDISVHNLEEVTNVSERIVLFCQDHGVDRKRAVYAGLALEEMAGNVVQHGFTKGRRRDHTIDLRVIYDQEKNIILRIRDDCLPFNPEDMSRLREPEDPLHNVGIRVVFNIAKDIRYQYVLGLNVLTLTI